VQKLYSVSETATERIHTDGDPGSRFDGRNNARKTVVLLHHPRFLFQLRKDDRDIIIVVRIIFACKPNQRFGHNFGNRNGAASGKRMLRSDRHANALAKQLLILNIAQRTRLLGTSYQSDLKPAIAYAVENGFVAPIVQSDVHLWHRLPKSP